jgi:hypothetical protein
LLPGAPAFGVPEAAVRPQVLPLRVEAGRIDEAGQVQLADRLRGALAGQRDVDRAIGRDRHALALAGIVMPGCST